MKKYMLFWFGDGPSLAFSVYIIGFFLTWTYFMRFSQLIVLNGVLLDGIIWGFFIALVWPLYVLYILWGLIL
jgi:hypothetical protein